MSKLPATLCISMISLVLINPSGASSPGAWAELVQRAFASCLAASGLDAPRVRTHIDFPDVVLVIVDGRWPQRHMNNAAAQFACLFDKRTQSADVREIPN